MDTILIAPDLPITLAFLDTAPATVITKWEEWIRRGEVVKARCVVPGLDAVIVLVPSAMGVVQFIPNDPVGRRLYERGLFAIPMLSPDPDAADLPPQQANYWKFCDRGYSARFEDLPDGAAGLILGQWEDGRI